MFAITSFAQSTFAGLGIVDYVDSVSETISLTDIQTSSAQFVGTQANTQTLTDTTDVLAGFVGVSAESLSLSSIESVLAQFNCIYTDSQLLTDSQYARGWFKIDDTQGQFQPQTYSTESIAELAFAETSGKLPLVAIGWLPVDDNQATSWTAVNDSQTVNWTLVNDIQ